MSDGTSSNFEDETGELETADGGTLSDDPELARMIETQNADLESQGVPRQVVTKVESEGMNLAEDIARLEEAEEITPDEDFEEMLAAPEIAPSNTLVELQNAVAIAKIHNIDAIEASRAVISHFTRPNYPKNGFFHYQGVRVIETGKKDQVEKFLKLSIEDAVFKNGARAGQ